MRRVALAVAVLSASVIGVQVGFMRALRVVRDFHFSYFVIAIALLGFGAGGTVLALRRRRRDRDVPWRLVEWAAAAFAVTIPLCLRGALRIEIDFQYLLLDAGQLFHLFGFALLAFVPFFAAGLTVGAILTRHADSGPLLYGANLVGSGVGAVGVLALSAAVPPESLYTVAGIPAAIGFVILALPRRTANVGAFGRFRWLAAAAVLAVSIGGAALPPNPAVDQYKALAHFRTLAEQGSARRLLTEFSPQGRVDLYASPTFHYAPFTSPLPGSAPPEQDALLIDGNLAGALPHLPSAEDSGMFPAMPQSLPYRLAAPRTALLLGDTGGTAVLLSRYYGAAEITVVQPDRTVAGLLSGRVGGPDVEIVAADPRLYLESTDRRFDVIHLVSAESMPATGSGLHSLNESYVLTREGMAAMVGRLTPDGLLSITRGTQSPPRDNVRIFATAAAALRSLGIEPRSALLQARNYLAVTTLVGSAPIDGAVLAAFDDAAAELLMDVEHRPGMSPPGSQRNQVAGPEGRPYSYYYAANQAILSEDRADFYDSWVYRVEPATDERPYFDNFFRWRTLPEFREAYGATWIRRLELGYIVLSATAVVVGVLSLLLIAVPMALRGSSPSGTSHGRTIAYFATIGFAFMFVEIVAIQTFSQALGNHVYSATAVLAGLLVFSGLGSMTQSRVLAGAERRVKIGSLLAASSILLFLVGRRYIIASAAPLGVVGRFLVVMVLLLPVSYLLGWFFSSGLRIIRNDAPELVPWAWAANGFASVVASPLALLLSLEIGHSAVLGLAAVLYASLSIYRLHPESAKKRPLESF